jgi:hypothetical protein
MLYCIISTMNLSSTTQTTTPTAENKHHTYSTMHTGLSRNQWVRLHKYKDNGVGYNTINKLESLITTNRWERVSDDNRIMWTNPFYYPNRTFRSGVVTNRTTRERFYFPWVGTMDDPMGIGVSVFRGKITLNTWDIKQRHQRVQRRNKHNTNNY